MMKLKAESTMNDKKKIVLALSDLFIHSST